MTADHAKAHPDVDVRINEAEVCRSMGLYDESLTIYEQILAGLPESDGELVETVKTKIADIRSEIADREQTEIKRVSAKDPLGDAWRLIELTDFEPQSTAWLGEMQLAVGGLARQSSGTREHRPSTSRPSTSRTSSGGRPCAWASSSARKGGRPGRR